MKIKNGDVEAWKNGESRTARLGDVCAFEGGAQPPKSTFIRNPREGYIRLVQIQDFRRNDLAVYIPEESSTRRFDETDVMIGRYGPPVFQILRGLSGAYNVALMKAVPSNGMVKDYLYYLLQESSIQTAVISQSRRSAGQSGVQKEFLENLMVPLPPLPEQQRIAARLRERMATAETARQAVAAQVAATLDLPAALTREDTNDLATVQRPLGEVLDEVTAGIGKAWRGQPVLGATRAGLAPAKEGVGKLAHRYKPVTAGTVFYNPMRILLGSIALVDEGDTPGITSPDYVAVRGREGVLHPVWFYYWFRSPAGAEFIKGLTRGAVRERLLFNRIAPGLIPVPPWPRQLATVAKVRAADKARRAFTTRLKVLEKLPAALLREAFAN